MLESQNQSRNLLIPEQLLAQIKAQEAKYQILLLLLAQPRDPKQLTISEMISILDLKSARRNLNMRANELANKDLIEVEKKQIGKIRNSLLTLKDEGKNYIKKQLPQLVNEIQNIIPKQDKEMNSITSTNNNNILSTPETKIVDHDENNNSTTQFSINASNNEKTIEEGHLTDDYNNEASTLISIKQLIFLTLKTEKSKSLKDLKNQFVPMIKDKKKETAEFIITGFCKELEKLKLVENVSDTRLPRYRITEKGEQAKFEDTFVEKKPLSTEAFRSLILSNLPNNKPPESIKTFANSIYDPKFGDHNAFVSRVAKFFKDRYDEFEQNNTVLPTCYEFSTSEKAIILELIKQQIFKLIKSQKKAPIYCIHEFAQPKIIALGYTKQTAAKKVQQLLASLSNKSIEKIPNGAATIYQITEKEENYSPILSEDIPASWYELEKIFSKLNPLHITILKILHAEQKTISYTDLKKSIIKKIKETDSLAPGSEKIERHIKTLRSHNFLRYINKDIEITDEGIAHLDQLQNQHHNNNNNNAMPADAVTHSPISIDKQFSSHQILPTPFPEEEDSENTENESSDDILSTSNTRILYGLKRKTTEAHAVQKVQKTHRDGANESTGSTSDYSVTTFGTKEVNGTLYPAKLTLTFWAKHDQPIEEKSSIMEMDT